MKKIYKIEDCITFRRTHEKYGGLSNMSSGFPIYIEKRKVLTSEALYQACRFPDYPDIQEKIIDQRSPIIAKQVSREYEYLTRKDWVKNRVIIMNWCVHLKLLYNWNRMGRLLEQTMNKEIVELSSKDDFWGAFIKGEYAEGQNVLGLLLKQVRNDYRTNINKKNITLVCPDIYNFKLFGNKVENIKVDVTKDYHIGETYSVFDFYKL